MNTELPNDDESIKGTLDWPHAPPHRLQSSGAYFVTARTLDRAHHFASETRRDFVCTHLLALGAKYGWQFEAWAVLSNHYHFVAHSPASDCSAVSLTKFMKHFHADITRHINRLDQIEGRKIWHNYRETHLTFQPSYLARLNYTHNNPVHHALVSLAKDYPWCSAARFEASCTRAWVQTIYRFKYDEIVRQDEDRA